MPHLTIDENTARRVRDWVYEVKQGSFLSRLHPGFEPAIFEVDGSPFVIHKHQDELPDMFGRASEAVPASYLCVFCSETHYLELLDFLKEKYRTLIRVEEVTKNTVMVIVLGWNPHQQVVIPKDIIPFELWDRLEQPKAYLIARVNIGANEANQLRFSDFELAPELDPNDGLA